MARLSLTCSCGWTFFMPGTTQGHEIMCPSCGNGVPIPGRKPGRGPVAPGVLAAQKQSQASTIKILVGLCAVVAVVGIVVAIMMSSGSAPPETPEEETAPERNRVPMAAPTPPPRPQPVSAPRPVEEPAPRNPVKLTAAQIDDMKREVIQNVWMLNLSSLVSEVTFLRALSELRREGLLAQQTEYESKVRTTLAALDAGGEKLDLDPYAVAGDRIVSFGQRDLTALPPADAAAYLHRWLTEFRAGSQDACILLRGDKRIAVTYHFPEETKELLQIARHPALSEEGAPAPVYAGPISEELLRSVLAAFEGLPPGYRGLLTAEDRRRMEELLTKKKGTPEDVEFLKTRIHAECIPRFHQDAAFIRNKIAELEPKTKEGTATDVVHFKDGRKVQGQIIDKDETETHLKIKSTFGSVSVPKADVLRVERGKGAGIEFPAKFKTAGSRLEELIPLMAWCKEKNLRLEKDLVAYLILTLDAAHDRARTEVGLQRPLSRGPSGPMSGTDDASRNTAVARATEAIAEEVLQKHTLLPDVLTDVRRQTEAFRYTQPVVPPEKAARGVALIGNPLTFKPNELSVQNAMEMGGWWASLSADDKKSFARFFGLWCAYTRHAGSRK